MSCAKPYAGTKDIYLANCKCPGGFLETPTYIYKGSIVKKCVDPRTVTPVGEPFPDTGGTVGYPSQTIDPDYPYKVLGQISRENQKANVFTKAFDPKQRKIIVLMIAGFLLFLAVTNYD